MISNKDLREHQQLQLQQQQQLIDRTKRPSSEATKDRRSGNSPPSIVIDKSYSQPLPRTLDVSQDMRQYLTVYELDECRTFHRQNLYYFGQKCQKFHASVLKGENNYGYDDSRGDYNIVPGDHLYYRYEIIDILGKGSFGQVVKAIDHATQNVVAVKIIRNKKRFHQQALVEVKVLEKIRDEDVHDRANIIKIKSHFYFREHLCIVFDLLGQNLYENIKANNFRGFGLTAVKSITLQLVQALCLLHEHSIVHCDLKPENILMVPNGKPHEIKVIDFGSSCYESERIYTYIQSRFYRSPEVVLGLPYGRPIDMWSLGCIMAELYSGHPIFPAQDEAELVQCFMELLGIPTRELIESASRKKVFFHSNYSPRLGPNQRGRIRKPNGKRLSDVLRPPSSTTVTPRDPQQQAKADHDHRVYNYFLDFVYNCLDFDPESRLTPFEALRHPFLTSNNEPYPPRREVGGMVAAYQARKKVYHQGQCHEVPATATFSPPEVRRNLPRNNPRTPLTTRRQDDLKSYQTNPAQQPFNVDSERQQRPPRSISSPNWAAPLQFIQTGFQKLVTAVGITKPNHGSGSQGSSSSSTPMNSSDSLQNSDRSLRSQYGKSKRR